MDILNLFLIGHGVNNGIECIMHNVKWEGVVIITVLDIKEFEWDVVVMRGCLFQSVVEKILAVELNDDCGF